MGLLVSNGSGLASSFTQVSQNLANLLPASQLQAEAILANTQAVLQSTAVHSTNSGLTGTLTSIASSLTGGLLGASPILSGLMSLFGGGGQSAPPPLAAFFLPPSLPFQGANVPGPNFPGADTGQNGTPRAITSAPTPSSPQITIQIQALDSQSFMDHSGDIAKAVRDAMLNMHSLNDVISDL